MGYHFVEATKFWHKAPRTGGPLFPPDMWAPLLFFLFPLSSGSHARSLPPPPRLAGAPLPPPISSHPRTRRAGARGGGRDCARPRAPRAASTPLFPDAGHDERRRAAGGGGSGGGPRPPGWGTRPEELTARLAASRPAAPSAGRGGSGTDAALPPALPDAGHDERRRAVGGGGSGGGPRSPGWGRGRRS